MLEVIWVKRPRANHTQPPTQASINPNASLHLQPRSWPEPPILCITLKAKAKRKLRKLAKLIAINTAPGQDCTESIKASMCFYNCALKATLLAHNTVYISLAVQVSMIHRDHWTGLARLYCITCSDSAFAAAGK